jgi:hypothetical protein
VFLAAIERYGTLGCRYLAANGHHPNRVYRKAERAADRDYVEYGTSPWGCWLTDKGRAYLNSHRERA